MLENVLLMVGSLYAWVIENDEAASIGTKKRATIRDAMREKTTAKERSVKICPAIPSTKEMGRNTLMVVSVLALTAMATSALPFAAASFVILRVKSHLNVFQNNNSIVDKHSNP